MSVVVVDSSEFHSEKANCRVFVNVSSARAGGLMLVRTENQ